MTTHNYRFGYGRDEFERLGKQHRAWAEETRQFLGRAAFDEGATLVDLGCGPGYTSLDLAGIVGPQGRVIAVDRDGEHSLPFLEEQAAAAGLSNVETRAADLEDFDLPADSVEGVYGRWVLMYLPEKAVEALAGRIANWLKPGGACALAEFCNYRHFRVYPPSTHMPAITAAFMEALIGDRDCNPEIGNLLPGLLHRAGLSVELYVATKAIRATTPGWAWPDAFFREHLPGLVDEGHLPAETVAGYLADWEERSRDPHAVFFGPPVMEIVGRRS